MDSRTDVAWDDPAYTEPPHMRGAAGPRRTGSTGRRVLSAESRRAIAVCFVALTAIAVATYLYSISVPGFILLPGLASGFTLLLIAAICVADLVVYVVLRSKGPRPVPWRLVAIAGMAVLVIVATLTSAPLRVRFELARGDFDAYAERVLRDAEGIQEWGDHSGKHTESDFELIYPDTPESIGSFRIRDAWVVPEGLIIFDTEGAFLDDAGFAYLPHGTFPDGDGSFESPWFRSVGGDWYAFTSSW